MQDSGGNLKFRLHCAFPAQVPQIILRIEEIIQSVDYMWHDALPGLVISPLEIESEILGTLRYGECLVDEKFLIWVIFEITREFECIASIQDSDGQVLLIQVAEHLPKWLEPECADGRVFVRNGKLHLVLKPKSPAELIIIPDEFEYSKGLEIVRKYPGMTEACQEIQEDLLKMLKDFPKEARDFSKHFFNCFIPEELAVFLEKYPMMIGRIVDAFHSRDMIDNRYTKKMNRMLCKNRQKSKAVPVRVRFTRQSFAQIQSSSFQPPKIFYDSGFLNQVESRIAKSKYIEMAEIIGCKLTCGAEILYQNTKDSVREKTNFAVLFDESIESERTNWMDFSSLAQNDSDGWMQVSESDIDRALKPWEGLAKEDADISKAKDLIHSIKEFMLRESSYEGIEIEKRSLNDREEEIYIPDEELAPLIIDEEQYQNILRQYEEKSLDQDESADEEWNEMIQQMNDELGLSEQGIDASLLNAVLQSEELELMEGHANPFSRILRSI